MLVPVRPFTLAARLLHYGRYGSDAEDSRLQPLYLGWPGLVRGYTVGSFDASECHPTAADPTGCSVRPSRAPVRGCRSSRPSR